MLPPEIDALFADEGPMRYQIRRYCVSCVAHRILKFGWEPEVNSYGPRMMMLLAMHLPLHCRHQILMEAWQRSIIVKDDLALKLLESAYGVERVA